MKNQLRAVLLGLVLGASSALQAMTLERVDGDLFATGPTVDQDFLQFKEALGKGGIQRLILVNGPGGDLWTGMQVARMVQDARLKTVASGFCMSACSLIFMAGQERAFGTGNLPRNTMIGIHGAHDKDTKRVNPQAMPQMYALYKQQLGDKFDKAVINQALYDLAEAGGFLRMRELQRNKEADRVPFFCPSSQTALKDCQTHPGKDALSLGIVTQEATETLNLPDSMKLKLGFYGRQLTAPNEDMQERTQDLVERYCDGQLLCKTIASRTQKNYIDNPHNKALALGWNKQGFGVRWGADDAGMAMLRALYLCNHAKNNPKLCRLVAVNDHELLPFYEQAPAETSTLLGQLRVPSAELDAAEKEEPGASTPDRLRLPKDITGMSPRSLEGIERWDTRTMVKALQDAQRPVVIDVAAAGPMIPGALSFIHGGLAFDNASQEAAYAERFRHMLEAAVPQRDQTVVFYCASSSCWLSVNAAMRARQLGYTQVKWYRGGIQAWMQAGLPTQQRLPVAILN